MEQKAGGAAAAGGGGKRQEIVQYEGRMQYNCSDRPLDFSFMYIKTVGQLKKEHARGGRRQEIIQTDDEEEAKKNENGGGPANEETAEAESKPSEPKEQIIRAPQSTQLQQILVNNNISFANKQGPMGGRKVEETKTETKKKIVVKKTTTALFLQNNELRSVQNLPSILTEVMIGNPFTNLLWLDLSYNYLEAIEDDLLQLENLQTLYMHGNYITNLEETKKLANFNNLQSLTLYGNMIETIKNYRLWVLGVMYTRNENLRKLDQVVVTNREFDKVLVWKERIFAQKSKRLKTLKPDVIKAPPAPPKTEEEEKKQSNQ